MKWDNLILLPVAGYVMWPWAVLIPGGLLALAYFVSRKPFMLVTALLWGVYGAYEYLMKIRVLCSGECNIRVDLLLISPALYLISIVAAVKFFRRDRKSHGAA